MRHESALKRDNFAALLVHYGIFCSNIPSIPENRKAKKEFRQRFGVLVSGSPLKRGLIGQDRLRFSADPKLVGRVDVPALFATAIKLHRCAQESVGGPMGGGRFWTCGR